MPWLMQVCLIWWRVSTFALGSGGACLFLRKGRQGPTPFLASLGRAALLPGFQITLQLCQPIGRVSGELADPAFVNRLNRQGVEVIPAFPPPPLYDYQISFHQHIQMLHHGGAIEIWQQFGQGAGGEWTRFQGIENGASRFVRQCLENQIVLFLLQHVIFISHIDSAISKGASHGTQVHREWIYLETRARGI